MNYLLETPRVGLRRWQTSDLAPFTTLNQDPQVMRYLPHRLTRAESSAAIERFNQHLDRTGYCYFAAEERSTGSWIGFVGLMEKKYPIETNATVDIGWRLAPTAWGRGLASEAAMGCLRYAFADLGLPEVIAVAAHQNRGSIRVMEKIGMTRGGEFHFPDLPTEPQLNPCVYYRAFPELFRATAANDKDSNPC